MNPLPINKKEQLVYTFLMVVCMASVMTTYNVVIHDGISLLSLQKAWLLFPISYCIAFAVEWFCVGHVAHRLIGKYVKETDPLPKKIGLSALFFVTMMVLSMSTIFACLFNPFEGGWWAELGRTIPRNFLLAYPLQVFVAGPLVGFIFRKIFPIGTIIDPIH